MRERLFKKLQDTVKKKLEKSKGSHDWEHTERVLKLALHIGAKEKANLKVLKFAALLHDIGRAKEFKSSGKSCHAQEGAKIARRLLETNNMKKEFIDQVCHAIGTHRFRGKNIPESLEAKVLFDADKLDSIGAVGIGRSFLFAGEVGAKLHNSPGTKIEDTHPYSEEDTAYREFKVKLQYIKGRMFTQSGLRMACRRHVYMVEFFKRLKREIDAVL